MKYLTRETLYDMIDSFNSTFGILDGLLGGNIKFALGRWFVGCIPLGFDLTQLILLGNSGVFFFFHFYLK